MRVLVIAAHPDDEVLGMGGTITKYCKNGHKVKVVIMATGILSRRSPTFKNSTKYRINKKTEKVLKSQVKNLQKNALRAAKIMGVQQIDFVDFPDNEMDTISGLEITKKIENYIKNFKPSILYTHSKHDVNIDHRIIFNATLTATRPKTTENVKQVISFEVPSSTEWYFTETFSPNIFVDITSELNTKKKALQAYKQEIQKFPHPRSVEALDAIARRWGTVSGFKAAEAFTLVRKLEKAI